MAPTGQTVTAMLLVLGFVRGPSVANSVEPATGPESPARGPESPSDLEEPAPPVEAEAGPEPGDDASLTDVGEPDPRPDAVPLEVPEDEPPEDDASEDDAPEGDAPEDEDWEDGVWEDEVWENDGYDPLRDSPEALAAQRRTAGGAVVLGLGTMVSLGGLAMVLSDPCARPAGNSCSSSSRNRAALTMALPGLATVAVGSVMLALGIRQRKALRLEAGIARSGGGVSLRGRF